MASLPRAAADRPGRARVKSVDRPCSHCAHWLRWDQSRAAVCGHDGRVQIIAQPERGCAF